jgi:hypothetical protein
VVDLSQLRALAIGITTTPKATSMPSVRHEFAVELMGNDPQLLRVLLGRRLDDQLEHPATSVDFRRSDATVGQVPTLGCDLCIELCWPGTTMPCLVLVVEVQLAINKDKPPAWFAYQACQHYRTSAPAVLVVVTNSHDVARWAAGPFWSGQTWLRPIVLGPGDVPAITDPEEARRSLGMAFLSGIVHGLDMTAVRIGLALAHAIDGSPDDGLSLYWDAFLASLGEPVRKELEMQLQHWQPRSDWGRKIYNEGKEAGRAEGELVGRAADVIALLELRGLAVSAGLRERVMACNDGGLLERWFHRAALGRSLEETFMT